MTASTLCEHSSAKSGETVSTRGSFTDGESELPALAVQATGDAAIVRSALVNAALPTKCAL